MSQVQPITIEEQDHYLATRQVMHGRPASRNARSELKSMLVASVAPTLAPQIDEPALHTVEPMTCRFAQTVSWTKVHGRSIKVPNGSSSPALAIRKNAPFPPTAIVTVLVANPKKPGSKSHQRFALYRTGQTIADQIKAGVLMVDAKWDAEHGFIKVTSN